MLLKTKGMQKIYEPINTQMNRLRQLLKDDSNNASSPSHVETIISDELQELTKKFDRISLSNFADELYELSKKFDDILKENISDYQIMKIKITDIIKTFCSMNNVKLTGDTNINIIENAIDILLTKFMLLLKTLEDLQCLPLKQQLQDCLDYVQEMGAVCEIEDFQNIKELGTSILEVFEPLQRYRRSLISKSFSERIALYSSQLSVSLDMLVQLVKEQHQLNASIFNSKKYICGRLCSCFQMILEIINTQDTEVKDEIYEKENHFVFKMDLALDIILGMSNKPPNEQISECEDLWLGVEEVFSHAMAIAQVCSPYNFKAITGACQSIMSEFENFKHQLLSEPPDPTLNNLFMHTLNDALYRLERKINVSVLTMVMEVFSDPSSTLKKLVMSCGNALNAKTRCKEDLNNLIEDFDQLMDRTMQIGLFAIACCGDASRTNKVRNSLAGLESLETELVSAIIAFYLYPDNRELRAGVKLLTAQWQSEMNKLHQTVDVIIDSSAYCQVILDDLQTQITLMSECLDDRKGVSQSQVQCVVKRAAALSSQISALVNDIGRENIDRQTSMMIRELKAGIFEANIAAKTILVDNPSEPQQLRVIKRCELILNVVKRLQPILILIINHQNSNASSHRKNGSRGRGDTFHGDKIHFPLTIFGLPFDEKTLPYIRTPYTVKNYKLPLSIQPANSAPRKEPDISCLMPYIQKGRMMRTEQSLMYKTPKKSNILGTSNCTINDNKLKTRSLSTVRQHLFSRDSFKVDREIDLSSQSIDLTAILDQLTQLSITFDTLNPVVEELNNESFDKNKKLANPYTNPTDNYLDNLNQSIHNKVEECSASGGGDAPSLIKTPERIDDLKRLDKKIESLHHLMKEK